MPLNSLWNNTKRQQKKIRQIYITAYADAESHMPQLTALNEFVAELDQSHSSLSPVRFWRVFNHRKLFRKLDDAMEGVETSPLQRYTTT